MWNHSRFGQRLAHHIGCIFADTRRCYRPVEFVGLAPARFEDLREPRAKRLLATKCDIGQPQSDKGGSPCPHA